MLFAALLLLAMLKLFTLSLLLLQLSHDKLTLTYSSYLLLLLLLLLLELAFWTRLAATEAAERAKLMKVKPLMAPAGAQSGSAS